MRKYIIGKLIPIDINVRNIPFNQQYNHFMQLATLQSVISDLNRIRLYNSIKKELTKITNK